MNQLEALAQLRREHPSATEVGLRLSSSLPANPGWRCQVWAWFTTPQASRLRFGRGETFEAAFADMQQRSSDAIAIPRAGAAS